MEFTTQAAADGAMRMAIDGDLNIYHADEIKRQPDRWHPGQRGARTRPLARRRNGQRRVPAAGPGQTGSATSSSHALRIVGHGPAVREVIEFFNMAAFFGDPLVIPAGEHA
jgi:hypothetical protein